VLVACSGLVVWAVIKIVPCFLFIILITGYKSANVMREIPVTENHGTNQNANNK
jgi:hypothetical protein